MKQLLLALTLCMLTSASFAGSDIVKTSGIRGGLLVHLGPIDGLQTDAKFVVHGLYRTRKQADQAREKIDRYGAVSAQCWPRSYLPYADNIVNLLIAEDLGDIPPEEVTRVLAPLGVAMIKSGSDWMKTVKPWPKNIDEWTHFLHGPDNNAVARDTRVGLPKHVQWIAFPKFARSHEQLASVSAMVTAAGRVFYMIDEGQRADIRMPPRWKLVARDAFSGVLLWKRNMDKWTDHMRSFRAGPADLAFRLVAEGDRVYATLGIDAPVTALDAATGKTLLTYKDSGPAHQIINTGKALVMLVGDSQEAIHMRRRGDAQQTGREILVADRTTGKAIWRKRVSVETLIPLVVAGDRLLYQTDKNLVCLELKSGSDIWSIDHPCKLTRPGGKAWQWVAPTLVASGGIAYVADFSKLTAFSIKDGKSLWSSSATAGFCSPPDIFVIDDLVWRGYTRARGAADFGQGLDARTGKLTRTLDTKKAWEFPTLAHHRCYRPKATSRFIMSSRSGVEFIDLKSGKISPNHWIRGTCQYGIMPANGLLYAPPHSCACNIKTMLKGLLVTASSRQGPKVAKAADIRLETGPAFEKTSNSKSQIPNSKSLLSG